MKKTLLILGLLGGTMVFAQNEKGRVGVNTETPKATLDISKKIGVPATQPQGVLFPHITTVQRNQFDPAKLIEGLMIYNTDKKCIELWNGTQWACINE